MPSERVQRRIDRLLDDAESAADQHDWAKVLECTSVVLHSDPENEDALEFKGMAEVGLKQSGHPVLAMPQSDLTSQSTSATESPGTSNQPTSFASGRYTVSKFLGEGGKKRVYLAHDNTLDRDVAFALIKTEGLDETSRERVKREAQAMGRMGTHPSIMPIYDLGEEAVPGISGTQPYMVQPLMGGGDVEGLVEDAEGPLPLDRAIEIATQTAQGLSFAHSKGIIHRDLKPGNVWLDEDGAAKIGDFGLAVATDRSRLTVEKVMVGTVSYMPPEQATGGEVTPKADLYSLGAMLYEMSTGRPPFLGDDDIAIISQHVNTPPVAPSWHNSQIPKTLDSLVMRLLAKDPAERPESADEVLAALQAVDLSAVTEDDSEKGTGSLDSMAGGVFVGRHREMDLLKAAFEQALTGQLQVVALVGESGVGKSRTAQELATYATLRGAQVMWGRCHEEKGAPPYCPWLQAIWACAHELEPGDLRSKLGSEAPEIADAVPYIRERLPDIPPASMLEPDQARYRFFNSAGRFFDRMSQVTPRLIVLDDLHWADESSLYLLTQLPPILHSSRIMIVLAYRDNELSLRHPLSRALGDLQRQQSFSRVKMRGFSQSEISRFIEMAAGVAPPSSLAQAIHNHSEGNPLFVTEIVRLLIEEGDVGPEHVSDRNTWSVRIPEGVKAVVGTRLAKLADDSYDALGAASAIGREFQYQVLASVLKQMDPTHGQANDADQILDEAIESGIRSRVIEEIAGSPLRYRFSHSLIQQTLYEELSAIRALKIHQFAANALQDEDPDDVLEITSHLLAAGNSANSEVLAGYVIRAGDLAMERYAYEKALEIFQRALASQSELGNHTKASVFFGLGRAQSAMLQRKDAVESLTAAFDVFESLGDQENLIRVASCPVGPGQTGDPGLLRRALDVVDHDSYSGAALLSQWGLITGMSGKYREATDAFDRALRVATQEEDISLQAWTLARRGHVEIYYCKPDECISSDSQALQLNETLGDPHVSAYAGACIVASLAAVGELDRASEYANSRIASAEEVRWQLGMAGGYSNAAKLRLISGEWKPARELFDRAKALMPEGLFINSLGLIIELVTGESESSSKHLNELRQLIANGARADLHFFTPLVVAEGDLGLPTFLPAMKRLAVEEQESEVPVIKAEAAMAMGIAAIFERDRTQAEISYELMKDLAGVYPMFANEEVSTDRILGLLQELIGDLQQAQQHFDLSTDFLRRTGCRPELARASADYSEMLLDRKAPGDFEKTIELQDEAIAIATELGMKPLLERVLAKREILKA